MGNIINGQEWFDGVYFINPNFQYAVKTKTDDYTLNKYSDTGSVLVMNAATNKTITLPAMEAADIGKVFIFTNINTGRLTIQAGTSDVISDSAAAGTIYTDTDNVATLILIVVAANQMNIFGSTGTWTTT
jgi:hypothetical protein